MVARMSSQREKIKIPDKIIQKWQSIVDTIAGLLNVPAALIMKVELPYIKVFRSSKTKRNPYKVRAIPLKENGKLTAVHSIARNITEGKKLEGELETYRERLEELVGERTAELQREIVEHKRAEEELKRYRNNLEELVEQRTIDLVKAKMELERQIEDRRRAEQALAMSEASLKRAQEVALIGSWDFDIIKNEFSWSEGVYEVFGPSSGTRFTYEKFLEMVHPDDREYIDRSWKAALDKKPYDIEHRILVDGNVKWVREKAEVEFDKDGKPVRGIGIMQDITKRKQSEEEAIKLRQDLEHVTRVATVGELSQALAHEINQPLTAILTNAQVAQRLLEGEEPDLQEIREVLIDIVKDNNRAREVIQRLRALLKKEEAAHNLLDLNDIARDAMTVIRGDAAQRSVRVLSDLDPRLPAVLGDRIQLQQVILNLLLNALEAMGTVKGPRVITIQTRKGDKGDATLFVRDTGIGIDEKKIRQLFEPFYTTKPYGLGLGLSISRSIIETHGGTLSATPNQDRGATFCFSLPAAKGSNET